MENLAVGDRPSWLSDALFKGILEKTAEGDVQIYDVKVEAAVSKGENYSSQMYRVTLKYIQGPQMGFRYRKFIVKAELTSEHNFDEYNTGDMEIDCYATILPRVHNLLKSIGDNSQLAAHCYATDKITRPRYLIFEDLKERGFVNVDRKIGLDFDHMTMVMQKLAKWHAATAYLGEIDQDVFKSRLTKPITETPRSFDALFVNSMKACAEIVQKWPGCEVYAEKLQKLSKVILRKCYEAYDRDPNGFNCLTHSDLWMNNIMFKFNGKNQPEDVVLVDYAFGYNGSPGLDIAYFLFSSNVVDNGEKQWDQLLRIYHDELVKVLTKLNYKKKIPSYLDIYIEFLRRAHFALAVAVFLIPIRLVEDSTHADLGGLIGEEPEKQAFRKQLFGHPKYRSFLEPILQFCYNKGILDA